MNNFPKLKHFIASEFSRPEEMNTDFLLRLDAFRDRINVPAIITSSNSDGDLHVKDSFHYKGLAADIIVPRYDLGLLNLFLEASKFRFTGIGIYPFWNYLGSTQGGLHLDRRPIEDFELATWMGIPKDEKKTTRLNIDYVKLNHHNLAKYHII